jgi:uncharacterized membrane protein YkoI
MFPSKRKIYAGLAGIGITLGAAGLASAASSSSTTVQPAASVIAVTATTPTDPTTAASSTESSSVESSSESADSNKDETPSYTSSVTIPVAADGSEPTAAELQAVATVTADQATAAALASTPGTAGTTQLKSVGGNVVWEVDVTATAGGSYDVIIDAGNSTVLDTHAEGGHGGDKHADAAPSYTSSVTIPVAADGSEPTAAELQAVATVTADQATAAALASTPGTAGTTQLKSVAGNVVWEVDVTATAGGSNDVIIDAGNSTVLDTHVEGGHGGQHNDAADTAADSAATTSG